MKEEVIENLLIALEEAKDTFDIIIGKMKANGINYPYESVQYVVDSNYSKTKLDIFGLADMKDRHDTLREENKSGLRKLNVRNAASTVSWVLLMFAGANLGNSFVNSFRGVELPKEIENIYDMRAIIYAGGSLASSFVSLGLLRSAKAKNPDIQEVPGELYSIKENFKGSRAQIIEDIKMIRDTNNELWNILEQTRTARRVKGL